MACNTCHKSHQLSQVIPREEDWCVWGVRSDRGDDVGGHNESLGCAVRFCTEACAVERCRPGLGMFSGAAVCEVRLLQIFNH